MKNQQILVNSVSHQPYNIQHLSTLFAGDMDTQDSIFDLMIGNRLWSGGIGIPQMNRNIKPSLTQALTGRNSRNSKGENGKSLVSH